MDVHDPGLVDRPSGVGKFLGTATLTLFREVRLVLLSRAGLAQLERLTRAAGPAEACALLVGIQDDQGTIVRRVRPAPHGSTTDFAIAPDLFRTVEAEARQTGEFVCGVFHSHPRSAAVPSARDLELAWPGFDYLIHDGRTHQFRAWRLADDRSGFIEAPVELQAG